MVQAQEVQPTIPSKTQETIAGEDLSQMFEGFTPKLKYDPAHSTWALWYGTDIGKKKSTWPYGTFADDIAALMQKEWLSNEAIRDILDGTKTISEELAKKLFDLRYEKRKEMLIVRYEELFHKKFVDLPMVVQDALVDFSYNMCGKDGILSGFPEACKALKDENWPKFADEIADSKYADQVGSRRAGYWVTKIVWLSEKPLETMTKNVQEEVDWYKKVEPEIERLLAQIRRDKRENEG